MGGRCSIVLVALALCAGCGDDDANTDACTTDLLEGGADVPGGLRVGLGGPGAGRFAPIASGDDVELDMGTQGGWMVQPVARIGDAIDASACPRLVYTLVVDGIEAPGSYDFRTSFHEEDGGWTSDPVQLFISLDVEALDGRGATLSASVTDGEAAATFDVDALTLVNER